MSVDPATTIPIINFSKLVGSADSLSATGLKESEAEKAKLYRGFTDVGFVFLKNHWITAEAQQTLFAHARKLFALSQTEKTRFEISQSNFLGWSAPERNSGHSTQLDQKEAFLIGNDNDTVHVNQWPEGWSEFRTAMNNFFEKCHQVHLVLLKTIAQQVGIDENFFEKRVEARDHYLRLLHYPETTRESFANRDRSATHTDYGMLTLLFNDQQGGLQVQLANGEYLDVLPIPGHIIVNVGDLLSRWFNDNLRSAHHRVVMPPSKVDANSDTKEVVPDRYSIVWFGHPNPDTLVEPLEQCCTAASPKKYSAVHAGQYLVEQLSNLHQKAKKTNGETNGA